MDVMEAERIKFVHGWHEDGLDIPGCVANGINEEIAEEIYGQMIDFAKYAFNKSHAAAYAAIAMQTAYLKAHYPIEFAAGLLTSVMDDLKKLPVYVSEYRLKGYEILAPDVNSSGTVFTPVNGSICYGLSSIKNAGTEAVAGIIKEREENGLFTGYVDFVKRCRQFGRKTIEVLIKAGALDFSGLTRRTMIENLEELIKAYKKEEKNMMKGQMNIFDLMNHESDEYKASMADTVVNLPEYDEMTRLGMEKEATGFYVTGHPLDAYAEMLRRRYGVISNQWFASSEETGEYRLHNGDEVVIAGVVTENKVVYTKKDSKPMSIVTVEDSVQSVKTVFFPRVYERFGDIPQKGNLVAVRGTVKIDDMGISVFADFAFRVDSPPQDLYVRFKNADDYGKRFKYLSAIARKHSGGYGSVLCCFENSTAPFLPDRNFAHNVAVTPECVERTREIFGEWNVQTKDFHLFPNNKSGR